MWPALVSGPARGLVLLCLELESVWWRLGFGWVPESERPALASGLPAAVTLSALVSVSVWASLSGRWSPG